MNIYNTYDLNSQIDMKCMTIYSLPVPTENYLIFKIKQGGMVQGISIRILLFLLYCILIWKSL